VSIVQRNIRKLEICPSFDVGVSRRKVKEVRTIQNHGTPEDTQDVLDGDAGQNICFCF